MSSAPRSWREYQVDRRRERAEGFTAAGLTLALLVAAVALVWWVR